MRPGRRAPSMVSYSSSIHSMCCAVVMTSGAGTSRSGPMSRATCRTQPRQIRSCSRSVRSCGSQTTPPLPPPSGMSTTAHFHVIHIASARTMSRLSCGWKRIPPLLGPRASLCCTRKPRKTRTAAVVHAHRNGETRTREAGCAGARGRPPRAGEGRRSCRTAFGPSRTSCRPGLSWPCIERAFTIRCWTGTSPPHPGHTGPRPPDRDDPAHNAT